MRGYRTKVLLSVLSATVLLLAGCSVAEPSVEQSTELEASTVSEHTAEELVRVLEVQATQHPNSQVLSDQQLRESIPAAEAWLQELEVNPEECGLTLSAPVAEQLEHAVMAALQMEDSLITLASYEDAKQLAENFDAGSERTERCSRYTVLNGSQRVAFHMAAQEVSTEAERTVAHVLTSSDGAASEQQLLLKVADGNVMITINQPLQNNAKDDQFQSLSQQVNELLAALD